MSAVLDVLNNPWVIGIGGGVLSGVIVAVISRTIFSRRDKREFLQRVSLANNDILYAIRPGISEGYIPSLEVIRAMISATARKYGVEETSMHSLDDISSELIKEVMDSSFISANLKKEYCDVLHKIREPERGEDPPLAELESQVSQPYQQQLIFTTSVLVGVLTMAQVFLFDASDTDGILSHPERVVFLAVPSVLALLIAIGSVIFRDIQRLRVRRMNINFGPIHAELSRSKEKEEEKST